MVKIFLSYSESETEKYQISKIVELLETKPYIEKVYYWRRDSHKYRNIVAYMEEAIPAADIFIPFCSQAAKHSKAMKLERDMAIYQQKHIIPLYLELRDVDVILQPIAGIKIDNSAPEKIVTNIYRTILTIFEKESKSVIYKDISLNSTDATILEQLERQLSKLIPRVKFLNWQNKFFGFIVKDTHVTGLGLSLQRLGPIPEALFLHLTHLKILILRDNKLKKISEYIGKLKDLEHLDLFHNQLRTLPESFKLLRNLKELHLGRNYFNNFPNPLTNLKKLELLLLDNNQLQSVPLTLGNLINLKELHLGINQLHSLPKSIRDLQNLEVLRLYQNLLEELPTSIFELSSLKLLNLGDNPLGDLPDNIKDLKNLRKLWLNDTTLAESQEKRRRIAGLVPRTCKIIWHVRKTAKKGRYKYSK
ncbi:MAG: leucine-rich repeat domain-containing protein [Promethearchaeota archaeon]